MKKFNWDYLCFMLEKKGWSMAAYSVKKLSRSQSYLSYIKNQAKTAPPDDVIKKMIDDLELDTNALWQVQELAPQEDKLDGLDIPLESDFEIKVKQMLEEINTKLDMLMEVEEKINKLVKYLPEKTPHEKAKDILGNMTAVNGSCDFDDYIRRLGVIGISREVGEDVAKKEGFEVKLTGYGGGKKRWLRKKPKPQIETVRRA